MKLCFIANTNSIHAVKWVTYFAQKNHDVHWITLTSQNSMQKMQNITFYHLNAKSYLTLGKLYSNNVKLLVRKIKPDILHAHYAGRNGLAGALSVFHPFIVTAWGSDILIAGKSIIKKPFIKYILKRADLITCDAFHMRQAMSELGISEKKICIINFGIDTARFHPREKEKMELIKKKIGLPLDSLLIISLRSLEPIYDIGTLIQSIPKIIKKIPKAYFLIAGRGPEENHLKQLTHALGIKEKTIFLGYIPNNELPGYVASANAYVSTALSDAGIAASTAEAMATETPVVVTDSGENKLWIQDGINGFVIPVKNSSLLAEKIIYLLTNKKEAEIFGKLSREVIVERNDYQNEMAKMETLYKQLCLTP